jgi:hypothetical protein
MRAKPLQTDGASRTSGEGAPHERKRDLKQRVFDEIINLLAIVSYLFVMFACSLSTSQWCQRKII